MLFQLTVAPKYPKVSDRFSPTLSPSDEGGVGGSILGDQSKCLWGRQAST